MLLRFAGIPGPVALIGCGELVDRFVPLLNGWRFRETPGPLGEARQGGGPDGGPVITVRRTGEGYELASAWIDGDEIYDDETNIVCAFLAELIVAFCAAETALLGLHAGAVSLGGRLIVFPSYHKGGKSTLAAQLAARGARVFSDDVVPVRIATGRALALGIAPRLRLPLPRAADAAFRAFVRDRIVLGNARYAYLGLGDGAAGRLAPLGEEAPIAAFVMLDRGAAGPAALVPESASAVMRLLLRQHFGDPLPAVDLVALLHRLVHGVPCLRLAYREADEAAALLAGFAAQPEAAAGGTG